MNESEKKKFQKEIEKIIDEQGSVQYSSLVKCPYCDEISMVPLFGSATRTLYRHISKNKDCLKKYNEATSFQKKEETP